MFIERISCSKTYVDRQSPQVHSLTDILHHAKENTLRVHFLPKCSGISQVILTTFSLIRSFPRYCSLNKRLRFLTDG